MSPQEAIILKKCRICLKDGAIPIYGDDCASDLSYDVRTFGDIDFSEEDGFPKHLCEPCYKLLQSAIIFRKTAKHSDNLLKESEEKFRIEDDFQTDTVDNSIDNLNLESGTEKPAPTSLLIHKFFSEVDKDNENNKTIMCWSKSKISKVQCRICMKIVTKAYCKDHYALHDPNVPKYMCDVCGKSFRQRSALINHRFTHSTEFKFHCKVCPYRGRSSGLLKTHMRIHNGDYRYMCTECPARYLTKSNFNRHLMKHRTPEFNCDTCKRAFHSKLILERHIEVDHLGIKKHVCDKCGKAFGYRKAMMQHQLDVHKREKKCHGREPAYLEADRKKQEQNS